MVRYRLSVFSILSILLLVMGCSVQIVKGGSIHLPIIENFEDWDAGGLDPLWVIKTNQSPHELEATGEYSSPFTDIFPAGQRALYANDTANDFGPHDGSWQTWIEGLGNTAEQYLFFSMDFMHISGNTPLTIQIRNKAFHYVTRIRVRFDSNEGIEFEEWDARGFDVPIRILPADKLKEGKWYRIQFILRGTGDPEMGSLNVFDYKVDEFEGDTYELKNRPKMQGNRDYTANLDQGTVNLFAMAGTIASPVQIGEDVIDNVILRVLDYEAASQITIPALLADGVSIGKIQIDLKEDFYGSAAADIPITLTAPTGILLQGTDDNWGNTVSVITDTEGKATVNFKGSEEGIYDLNLEVETPWGEVQEIIREINISPAVSEENSSVQVAPESIVANNTDRATVTVTLKSYGENPSLIVGREVSLDLPDHISIAPQQPIVGKPGVMLTNANGKAIFSIRSNQPWQGSIIAKVDRAQEDLAPLSLESSTFTITSPISIVNSTISEPTIVNDVYNGAVPADGVSSYLLVVVLKDENENSMQGLDVLVEASAPGVNIEPLTMDTNVEGRAEFLITASSSGTYTLTVKAHSEYVELGSKTVTFVDDGPNFGPVVLSTTPEEGEDEAEASDPIKFRFNKPVDFRDLEENNLKLTIEATGFETITCTRKTSDGLDAGLWEYDEEAMEITWTPHTMLIMNEKLTVTLSGVVDLAGNSMADSFTLTFTAGDLTRPEVLEVLPRDGEVEVSETSVLSITFTEALLVEDGKPKGLIIKVKDQQGNETTYDKDEIQYFVAENKAEVAVNLDINKQYEVFIDGAEDFAGNILVPFTFKFETTDTIAPTLKNVLPTNNATVKDYEFDRKLKVVFSEKVDVFLPETSALIKLEIEEEPGVFENVGLSFRKNYDMETNTWEIFLENGEWVYDKRYRVTITGVKDCKETHLGHYIAINELTAPYSWMFTLSATSAPNVEPIDPLPGFATFPVDGIVRMAFDKAVLCEPMPIIEISANNQQDNISGELAWENVIGLSATELSFTPIEPLAYDTWYDVTIRGAKGENGIVLEEFTYSFRTEVLGDSKPVDPSQSTLLIFPVGPQGSDVTLLIPEDLFSNPANISAINLAADEIQGLNEQIWSESAQLTNNVYNISSDTGEEFLNGKKAILVLPYIEEAGNVATFSGGFVAENALQLCWWNPEKNEWLPLPSNVNPQTNTVTGQIDGFGIYALMGGSASTKFLTEVALTTNPIVLDSSRQQTTFRFRLLNPSRVTLTLYNSSGRTVAQLIDKVEYPIGFNAYNWDSSTIGRELKPGIYIYRLFATSLDPNNPQSDWVSGTLGIIWSPSN